MVISRASMSKASSGQLYVRKAWECVGQMVINWASLGKSSSWQLLVDRHGNESGGRLEAGEDSGSPRGDCKRPGEEGRSLRADCKRPGRGREAWSRRDRIWRAEERAARKGKRGEMSAGYERRRAGITGWRRKG